MSYNDYSISFIENHTSILPGFRKHNILYLCVYRQFSADIANVDSEENRVNFYCSSCLLITLQPGVLVSISYCKLLYYN